MVAPIISNDRVIGAFDLESDELNAYSEDDLAILQLLSSQVAIIIEKDSLYEQIVEKKRIETQLEIARQVQLELLPDRDPKFENFDMSAYVFPTEEVSGDYYDWMQIFEDQIGIVVADAVGKGIPAAAAYVIPEGKYSHGCTDRLRPAHCLVKGQSAALGFGRGTSVHHGYTRHPGHDKPDIRIFQCRP